MLLWSKEYYKNWALKVVGQLQMTHRSGTDESPGLGHRCWTFQAWNGSFVCLLFLLCGMCLKTVYGQFCNNLILITILEIADAGPTWFNFTMVSNCQILFLPGSITPTFCSKKNAERWWTVSNIIIKRENIFETAPFSLKKNVAGCVCV